VVVKRHGGATVHRTSRGAVRIRRVLPIPSSGPARRREAHGHCDNMIGAGVRYSRVGGGSVVSVTTRRTTMWIIIAAVLIAAIIVAVVLSGGGGDGAGGGGTGY
jgi:hypothetical protein